MQVEHRVSTPSWITSYFTSQKQQKIVHEALRKRERARQAIRSYHLEGLQNPPKDVPRPIFDFYSIAQGTHPDHERKNRYCDIVPYDRTRVLDPRDSQRYLNASWVLERFGHKWWIAAQAPLPQTFHAFLSLLQYPSTLPSRTTDGPRSTRIRTIAQLTPFIEGDRRKAHEYLPTRVGQSRVHSPEAGNQSPALSLRLLQVEQIEEACCIKSTVSMFPEGDESKTVIFHHLFYTAWPDHGVPEGKDEEGLMAFLRLVDSSNRNDSDDPDPPIVVGCSAGVGRTGTFIALSSILRSYGFLSKPSFPDELSADSPLGPLPSALDSDVVAQEVDSLREQRTTMVQQDSQLQIIYALLRTAFRV
ncbi:unnamed protein product [Mycena citricolor]|uniref:Phosphatases II n=1 Tax=Mycena citricolor TaxID=2018698 RepID=A0AAD2HSN4_9AGAR|nr:unnamed protein product [Mycena citricolor]